MSNVKTYVWHAGSDTFFALEDEVYLFKYEDLSESAIESLEEYGSMRGCENEGHLLDADSIEIVRGLL